jgi:uncharacterized membrane protein YidH (DUF202 family)
MIEEFQLLFLIYVTVSNFISVIAGFLLWIAFVFFGVVSRRYEQIFQKSTNWQLLMGAPTGILVFVIIQAYAYATAGTMTEMQSVVGHFLVIVSSVACLYGGYRFRKVISTLKEGSS